MAVETTTTCKYMLTELQQAIASHPDRWQPLVLTNGCFDLIHVGHGRYLPRATSLGQSLVVGLNSDSSVRLIKPATEGLSPRPIVPQAQRKGDDYTASAHKFRFLGGVGAVPPVKGSTPAPRPAKVKVVTCQSISTGCITKSSCGASLWRYDSTHRRWGFQFYNRYH